MQTWADTTNLLSFYGCTFIGFDVCVCVSSKQLNSTCIAFNWHPSKIYDHSLQPYICHNYTKFFITWIILLNGSCDVLKAGQPWNLSFKLSTSAGKYVTLIILFSSSASSQSKVHPWYIWWYMPSTLLLILHLNTPSIQPRDKNGPNILVNHPKFGLWPHKKCLIKIKSDEFNVDPIAEIPFKSWFFFNQFI